MTKLLSGGGLIYTLQFLSFLLVISKGFGIVHVLEKNYELYSS